ncbi:Oligoendopeptidase F, plasmid [Jeotgalicoccus aerolatus]|uniref:Oligopeptidase F n=1 Tax=Jeotgalicoccus aerolatus TaxID=709510 RepID=A0ABS4HM04_9STAP|nr:oligoendopeptidase F [Jeotgalicoccus aerolatus]MBP1951853.1 oligoendopeptidase F [Jeotgalicoccus aerolatus]GGD94271.1 oligoendopeptidase F [Jeotgalicoccus aerolatus]CAD2074974.1 Oligoendopeptidase F, plasmid [Jeotgalicoccus aerolatus]
MSELQHRQDVDVNYTWNLSPLFKDDDACRTAIDSVKTSIDAFEADFQGQLNDVSSAVKAIDSYRSILEQFVLIGTYSNLRLSGDRSDQDAQKLGALVGNAGTNLSSKTSFLQSELLAKDESFLKEIAKEKEEYTGFIEDLLRNKPYQLDQNVEKALASFSSVFSGAYDLYQKTKLLDIDFGTFTANGEEYSLSYLAFEGGLESNPDKAVRRAAFKKFSESLKQYEHTTAGTYDIHLKQEKAEADLRGYDSVIDYLLHKQKVDRELYDRQIDVITEDLAPHMRRYAKLLQNVHGLDKMRYEDLKIPLDPESEPEISVEESRKYILDALGIMGEDYTEMINRAYDERWIDFVVNKGKSTGAFCSSPYGSHPFILISWSSLMEEVFVLAHELGHAGHFYNANRAQNIFDTRPSMYFIEAPSTMNEMLMANHLLKNSEDPKFKRWVISSIISRTYYHNFVTHLLEAAYQREVYKHVDNYETVTAELLNEIKRGVIEKFWGDDVEITEGAELTWMRQPHYYMGLYPYTYSAGLTIATEMSQRILNEGQPAVDDWLKVLKTGGKETPVDLAKMAGIDITTDAPLNNTIKYVGALVDELEALTKEIEG